MSSNANRKKQSYSAIFMTIGVLVAGMIICFIFVDEAVFSWLQHDPPPFRKNVWQEAFGQLGKMYPMVWLLLLWVWLTGRHKTVLISLLALIITAPAVLSIKAVVKRSRPDDVMKAEIKVENKRQLPEKWSFPSGDTAGVFAVGTVLAISAWWPWVIGIVIGCSGIAALRVMDSAHHPSDVFAGAAIGVFCGWAALRIRNKNPKIEDIFAGREQMLSFVGIFLIPVLIWISQGLDELNILLKFYVPVAIAVSIIAKWSCKSEEKKVSCVDQVKSQDDWFFRWRSFLPLLILPLFLIVPRDFKCLEGNHLLDQLWGLFCFAISLLGLGIRIYTVGHVPAGTSGGTKSVPNAQELNTTSMYSIVRHPLYLANFIIWVGIVLFARSILLVAFCFLAFFLFYERIIIVEEKFLSQKFGALFAQWAEKTPMLVPKIKLWRRSAYRFSWRVALNREYPWFFAIIACFTTIEVFGDRFYEGRWQFDPVWVLIFLTGLCTCVILRALKKKGFLDVQGR